MCGVVCVCGVCVCVLCVCVCCVCVCVCVCVCLCMCTYVYGGRMGERVGREEGITVQEGLAGYLCVA